MADLAAVKRHARRTADALAARDAAIVAAVQAGASLREVAKAADLSHVGVAKIVRRVTGPPP